MIVGDIKKSYIFNVDDQMIQQINSTISYFFSSFLDRIQDQTQDENLIELPNNIYSSIASKKDIRTFKFSNQMMNTEYVKNIQI